MRIACKGSAAAHVQHPHGQPGMFTCPMSKTALAHRVADIAADSLVTWSNVRCHVSL
jgi:hypothetical protein